MLRNEYCTLIYLSLFTFCWGHSKTYSASLLSKPENGFYLVRINVKKCIATNFHVTFRFLNFRMIFSRNVSGFGSIVTAIILELTYLWRNCIRIWIRNKEEKLHTFGRFKPIFHEGGTARDKQGVFQPQLGCLESF